MFKKWFLLMVFGGMLTTASVTAQNNDYIYDTTQFELLNEVVVSGVRVQKNAPFAVSNINKVELNDFSELFNKCLSEGEGLLGQVLSHIRQRGGKRMRPMLFLLYSNGLPSLIRSTLPPAAQRMASAAAVSHSLVLL